MGGHDGGAKVSPHEFCRFVKVGERSRRAAVHGGEGVQAAVRTPEIRVNEDLPAQGLEPFGHR